jgi:N-hydroxyarylamine O-acetyltransferase
LDRDNPIDFDVGNHYTATHPKSAMVNRLMLRALTADGRVTVMNREVTLVQGGVARTSTLPDRAALRALLVAHFGFDLPAVDNLCVPSIPEWRAVDGVA